MVSAFLVECLRGFPESDSMVPRIPRPQDPLGLDPRSHLFNFTVSSIDPLASIHAMLIVACAMILHNSNLRKCANDKCARQVHPPASHALLTRSAGLRFGCLSMFMIRCFMPRRPMRSLSSHSLGLSNVHTAPGPRFLIPTPAPNTGY